MKHIALISFFLVALSSCTLPWAKDSDDTATVTPTSTGTSTQTASGQNMMVSVNYTLRDGSAEGKILDTSIESVAKSADLYQTGRTYEPLEFVIGAHQVVPGFEAGVATMKKGEKKTIVVAPKDGYGELTIEQSAPKNSLAPAFTTTIKRELLGDTISQTVTRSQLGEQGSGVTVGQTLTGGQDLVAKVTKIEGDTITLAITNSQNPFYGKKLAVGEVSEKDGIQFTIKGMTDTGVTVDIVNKNSPFYGKDFAAGVTGTTKDGKNITIKSMSGDTLMVDVPNTHELAGKTLYFEVEVIDIK